MSTPFLARFAAAVVERLAAGGGIEIADGSEERVVAHVAAVLGEERPGQQLVSSLARALLSSPDVVEVYADDDALKSAIDDLSYASREP